MLAKGTVNSSNHIPWTDGLVIHLLDCIIQKGAHLNCKHWPEVLLPFYSQNEYLKAIHISSKDAGERKLKEKYKNIMSHWLSILGIDNNRPSNLSAQITPEQGPIAEKVRLIHEQIKEKEEVKEKKKAQTERLAKVEENTLDTTKEGTVGKRVRDNDEMVIILCIYCCRYFIRY
jgi:hypothetical protein